ncbi:alpha/beta fold hydrolase, partial [Roseateles sp. GG27B]
MRDQGPADDPLPIVLLHGTSASLHTWEGWVRELQKTRRVISFDLPGFGLTGPAEGGQFSGNYREAADVGITRALLDHLNLSRVALGGNSLGGEIAWQLAAAQPSRVAALILVDAGGYASAPQSIPLAFKLARLPLLGQLSHFVLPRSLVESSVRNVYGDPAKVTAEVVDRYFELALREGNRAALQQRFEQMRPGRDADRIKTLRLPTLILWGGRDRLIPPENGLTFARDIPGSRLVTFPALGHVPQEEDPAATLVPVREFLQS